MQTLIMMLQAIGFAIEALALFTLLGYGLVAWLLPAQELELLIVPVVGLAVLAVGFQLLTPVLPPWVTLVLLLAVLGGFSLWSAWRKRAQLSLGIRRHGKEMAFAAAAALLFYLTLLTHVFGAQFFTLAGWPSDNIFLYAPAGEYLRTHAFTAAHPLSLVDNPTTRYLAWAATAFPNSVGPLDGAMSVLGGWSVRSLFDPLNALLYALVVPATYFLLSRLGISRRARIAAVLLLIANQLLFWVMGNAFQQEMEAMPIFMASLALTIHALQSERPATAALAGLVAGSLLGLYFPICAVYGICIAGYAAVLLVQRGLRKQLTPCLRQLLWVGTSGLATSAVSLYWLLPGGGLYYWLQWFHTRIPAGAISTFYSPRYLLGVAPVADVWRLPWSLSLLWWRPEWNSVSRWLAYLVVLLIFGGVAALVLEGRLPELGLFAAAGLYLAYLRLVAQYPYGFMKTVSFLAPLTSALIAVGALDFVRAIGGTAVSTFTSVGSGLTVRRLRRIALTGGVVSVSLLLLAEAVNSIEMEHLWLEVGPAFPASYRALSALPTHVPRGVGVLLVNPSPAYHDGIKYAAARYYLTDNNVAINDRIIPESQLPFRYDFMLVPWPEIVKPGDSFRQVWSQGDVGLALYQRLPAPRGSD